MRGQEPNWQIRPISLTSLAPNIRLAQLTVWALEQYSRVVLDFGGRVAGGIWIVLIKPWLAGLGFAI